MTIKQSFAQFVAGHFEVLVNDEYLFILVRMDRHTEEKRLKRSQAAKKGWKKRKRL